MRTPIFECLVSGQLGLMLTYMPLGPGNKKRVVEGGELFGIVMSCNKVYKFYS